MLRFKLVKKNIKMSAIKIFYLLKSGLPRDIVRRIIGAYFSFVECCDCYKKTPVKTSRKCDECGKWLCEKDEKRALQWGTYYTVIPNYRMCDGCCWNSIT